MRNSAREPAVEDVRRWLALLALSLGGLVTTADMTIVGVALASIRSDMHFSEASAIWVVNGYMATYGGLLLLSGRLADLFGQRRFLLLGIFLFTFASLGCGLAMSKELLVAARCLQGVGGAIVSVMALALTSNLFTDASKRVKALGIFAFTCTSGGSIGLLLGGVLTSVLGWRWIFLINIPAGACLYALCAALVPRDAGRSSDDAGPLDIAGAVTLIVSLMFALYAIVTGNELGWTSPPTLTLLAVAFLLTVLFIAIEARVQVPLIPRRLLRIRNLAVANIVGMLFSVAVQAWIFISALYLQFVLNFSAMETSFTILPASVLRAVTSLTVSPMLITRFGARPPLFVGMLTAAVGLALLGRAPVNAKVALDVIPGLLILGLGIGMAYNCLLLSALDAVSPSDSGIVSGIVHTSFTLGGALGLSFLAGVAASRTNDLLTAEAGPPFALTSGYHAAFWVAAALASLAAVIGGVFLRSARRDINRLALT